MKLLYLLTAVGMLTLQSHATVFDVVSLDRIEGAGCANAVISPDGSFVVTGNDTGLEKIDLATGARTQVAEGEGLYDVAVSADGTKVAYVRPSFNERHLRHISLEAVDIASGKRKVVVKPSRRLNAGISFAGSTVCAVEKGKAKRSNLGKGKALQAPLASINYGHLDVTVDGKTTSIDPNGPGSYLWPQVSPNGKRVVYRLSGFGTYTCNLDGSDVRPVGNYMMTVWAGNDSLIGVAEEGGIAQQPTASRLVAVDIATGETQRLTPDEILASFPSVSADGRKVIFGDSDGALYLLQLSK